MANARAWWCPVYGRATPKCYRCANFDCQADLAGTPLERVDGGA